MMVNVFVTPEFIFTNGQVTGRIIIDPDSLVNAIYTNSLFSTKDPRILGVKREVAKLKNAALEIGMEPPVISLETGIVSKNILKMDLLDVADLLFDYLGYYDTDINHADKSCHELYEFLQKCKDIKYPSEMANIA